MNYLLFNQQRNQSVAEFLENLDPTTSYKSIHAEEEFSANIRLIHFLFNVLGQELPSQYIDDPNILTALQKNDIAYRFIKTNTIDLEYDFGTIICMHQEKGPCLIYRQDVRIAMFYAGSNTKVFPKEDEIRAELGKSMEMAIQVFSQLPWKIPNIASLAKFVFYGMNHEISAILTTTFIIAFVQLLIPIFTSAVFSEIVPGADYTYLFVLIAILIPVSLSLFVASFTRSRLLAQVETSLDYRLQSALVNRILRQPLAFLQKFSVSDFVLRLMGITEMRKSLTNTVLTSVFGLIFGLLNLCLMLYYQFNVAIIVIISYSFFGYIFFIVSKRQSKLASKVLSSSTTVLDSTSLLLDAVPQIRSTATESFFLKRWAYEIRNQAEISFSKQSLSDGLEVLSNSTYQVTLSILLFLVSYDYITQLYNPSHQSLTGLFPYNPQAAGSFLAFLAAFTAFNQYYESFVMSVTDNIISSLAQWERSSPVIFKEPELGYQPQLLSVVPSGNIQFSDVTSIFSGRTVLDKLNLTIQPGDQVGITGPTGSGKSSFIRLISGVYLPDSGKVLIDSESIDEINLKTLRQSIGIVTQNTLLPASTIKDFIAPSFSYQDDKVWHALELACLADDVQQMPMKLNTILSEGGSNISGGQRQRLIIAKALIKDPKILLLDEASSAISESMQEKLTENIQSLNITSLQIAHRVSTLKFCDRIHIFMNGKIIETGSYDELIKTSDYFKKVALS